MLQTFSAVYDGRALYPETAIALEKDKRYRITIQAEPAADLDAWQVLEALAGAIDAPEDWSLEHDHYLYGTPKQHAVISQPTPGAHLQPEFKPTSRSGVQSRAQVLSNVR